MPSRKRGHEEIEPTGPPETPPLLKKLRNMWEFACLMQYIFIFGDAVRIDRDFDVEDLEAECIRPENSTKLTEIGLCLLKNVSSHRGLTPENFDEYTRRQYQAKKPNHNPFGDDESPRSFHDFDIIRKIRVLVDLSQWTLINANNIKEKMELSEKDQANEWRIEPCGWDKDDRTYYVLDDNRLYRRTDAPLVVSEPPKPTQNRKSGQAKAKARVKAKPKPPPTRGTRASKRLKVEHEDDMAADDEDEDIADQDESKIDDDDKVESNPQDEEDTFGGMKWECVAVSLEDYNEFLASIQKTRDMNERLLFKFITIEVMPIIEAAEERRRQKAIRRQRELEALQKLATAKRSSRIADKRQQEIEEAETRALEEKRRQDLLEAQAMLKREQQMEQDRESRRLTREQRIKERELRRVLEEEALKNLTAAEAQSEQSEGEGRKSKRQLRAEIEKKRKAVEELQQEEDWVFDCSGCGVHGPNLDDGSHSVACDRCNVWQHSACLGISEAEAEKEDFHLICNDCRRKEEEASRPKPPPIKLKLNQSSSSPPSVKKRKREHPDANGSPRLTKSKKQTNGSVSDEWHNTFAYPQPPNYAASPSNFVAFKPEKYYINGTNSAPGPSGSSGFGANHPPRVPGQPPIGKFVNYSSKKAHPAVQSTSVPKAISNGHPIEPITYKAPMSQAGTGSLPSNSENLRSQPPLQTVGHSPFLSSSGPKVTPLLGSPPALNAPSIPAVIGLNGTVSTPVSNNPHVSLQTSSQTAVGQVAAPETAITVNGNGQPSAQGYTIVKSHTAEDSREIVSKGQATGP